MKEYIEFNLAAFNAADKAVTLVDQYAEKIEATLMEIDKILSERTSDKSSVLSHGGVYDDISPFIVSYSESFP